MKFALVALIAAVSSMRLSTELMSMENLDMNALVQLDSASMEQVDLTPAQQATVDATAEKSYKEMGGKDGKVSYADALAYFKASLAK